jgi:hypothetical protein
LSDFEHRHSVDGEMGGDRGGDGAGECEAALREAIVSHVPSAPRKRPVLCDDAFGVEQLEQGGEIPIRRRRVDGAHEIPMSDMRPT